MYKVRRRCRQRLCKQRGCRSGDGEDVWSPSDQEVTLHPSDRKLIAISFSISKHFYIEKQQDQVHIFSIILIRQGTRRKNRFKTTSVRHLM